MREKRPKVEKKCYVCNELGHLVRDCPLKDEERPEKRCHTCNEEGHLVKDCPNKANQSKGDRRPKRVEKPKEPLICHNCNKEGHMARDCGEPRKEREPREARSTVCRNCN